MTTRRALTKALGLGTLAFPMISRAFAQPADYPAKLIQMVVGFPAGQASDVGARMVAKATGEDLKQIILIDNKPGAAGIIAHQYAKNAAPDGYTLLFSSTGPLAINPGLYKKLPYDPLKDFLPVVLLNTTPMFLATAAETPVNDLKEMVAYVKARPGQMTYGSGGNGTTQHIAMEMLKQEAGLDLLHVPYKGSPPMVNDLIAGRVNFAFETSTVMLPYAKAGSIKLIAVGTGERLAGTPNVPTIAEQGLPGFEVATWAGILVPAGTPGTIVERLNAAINRALASKELIEHFARTGATIKGGSSADFNAFLKVEVVKWSKAVIASGAQVD